MKRIDFVIKTSAMQHPNKGKYSKCAVIKAFFITLLFSMAVYGDVLASLFNF